MSLVADTHRCTLHVSEAAIIPSSQLPSPQIAIYLATVSSGLSSVRMTPVQSSSVELGFGVAAQTADLVVAKWKTGPRHGYKQDMGHGAFGQVGGYPAKVSFPDAHFAQCAVNG